MEKPYDKPVDYSEKDSSEHEEEGKTKFKWRYFCKLLEINRKYKKHYIVGIMGAILLGAVFPSFSVVLATLLNIGVKIESSTDYAEKEELAEQSHVVSAILFILAFMNLVMIIVKEFSFL